MTKPVVTHVTCSTVTPRAPIRCGTATLTIDASIAPISVPNVIDSVTSHLLTGGRSVWTRGRARLPAVIAPHPPLRGTLSRRERDLVGEPSPSGEGGRGPDEGSWPALFHECR